MKTAFLFPGQGAQITGMGSDIAGAYPEAAELFDRANEIVGYDLKNICFNGPEDKLSQTTISQPAIFVTSAAILEVIHKHEGTIGAKADVAAGLSLGEYTALYAAGVIDFEQGVRLVQKRGNAMQAAADASDGSMVSVLGLDADKVAELCDKASEGELLVGANYNCPGQIVISGASGACQRAVPIAEELGAIKAIPLKVAGAFHTELMRPAADALSEALSDCNMNEPGEVKVLANISGEYYGSADDIRNGLVRQLVEPILWQKCMEGILAEGVEKFYEIGPGRVLTGLMRRVNRKTRVVNVSNLDSLSKLLAG